MAAVIGDRQLAARLAAALAGEVLFDAFSRGRYATDASHYQIEPVGVVVPRSRDDVVRTIEIAGEIGVPVLPRGGGTSQCGQTVGAWGQGCVDDGTDAPDLPVAALALHPNVPNPFNPSTRLVFELPAAADVTLTVLDAAGARVRTLIRSEGLPAGRHRATWDGRDDAGRSLGSGAYLFRLEAGGGVVVRKGVLLK